MSIQAVFNKRTSRYCLLAGFGVEIVLVILCLCGYGSLRLFSTVTPINIAPMAIGLPKQSRGWRASVVGCLLTWILIVQILTGGDPHLTHLDQRMRAVVTVWAIAMLAISWYAGEVNARD